MTYFGFLARFLLIPVMILGIVAVVDQRRGRRRPPELQNWPAWAAILVHVVVALLYTTPWDNYLVATGVWWYEPALVTGIAIGWVPIEEYTFFVVQTILGGLLLLFLARRTSPPPATEPWRQSLRIFAPAALAVLWLMSVIILVAGWAPGTYLALELVWALPPIALQLAFGADILWRYRRIVLAALTALTLYLAVADFLAIGSGTWTIDPAQSLAIYIAGTLPAEEVLFFLLTNTLVVFGITLLWSIESRARFLRIRQALAGHSAQFAPEDKAQ